MMLCSGYVALVRRTLERLKTSHPLSLCPQAFKHYTPMSTVNAHIQVLGTGSNELAPSCFLFTDSRRYLFNCSENLLRFRTELRPPLTVTDVFLTYVSWGNIGGFPGMVMYSREQGVPTINLHGPELVEEVAELTRYFAGRKRITLVTPSGGDGVYEDKNLRIRTVPLYSTSTQSLSSQDLPDDTPRAKRPKVTWSSQNSTAAFVCKLSDVPGKFDVARAKALGLRPGPVYGQLQKGECVTAPDGGVVRPQDVLGPSKTGPVMIVVECPDVSYVSSVVSHPSLSAESFTASNQNLALIVHMSPGSVLRDKSFQHWMSSFGPSTKHLILNKEMCPSEITLRKFLKVQAPLHLMNPAVYHPLLDVPRPPHTTAEFDASLSENIVFGKTLLKYYLKPAGRIGVDGSSTLRPLADDYVECLEPLASNDRLMEAIESSRTRAGFKKLSDPPPKSVSNKHLTPRAEDDNPVITFLGTGSATPTCYRNVSGILVQTGSHGNILLDCGEGSLTQIYRYFGEVAGENIIRNISGVFISHLHGDHHLGLVGVLVRREELVGGDGEPPLIIAPSVNLTWLSRYSNTCQRLSYRSIQCNSLEREFGQVIKGLHFQTVPVIHCKEAYGVVVKHSSGWSLVYSGDTRPCQELVKAGNGATVLIHEATFEDSMSEDAVAKLHCTFGEALKISSEMRSKFTLMTHFSTRYPKLPSVLMDSRIQGNAGIGIAMDGMSVRLKELGTMQADLPAIREIFAHMTSDGNDDEQTVTIQDWEEEATA